MMSSCTRKHCPQQITPGKKADVVDKPFPNKPVCHKRFVNPAPPDLLGDFEKISISKKCQEHIPNSVRKNKDSSRLPASELQMARVIHEKQLILQKKLLKVEDTLRQKIQRDKLGSAVKDNHQTVEDKYYGRWEEKKKVDNKPRQKTEVTGSEVLMQESEQNVKQQRYRQDTITKKHEKQETKGDKKLSEITVPKRRVNKLTYVHDEETPSKSQQAAACRTTTGHLGRAETGTRELVLPQVSSLPSEHDSTNENIQLLPCQICNRTFLADRLEKHMQICKKVKTLRRPVFNSYKHRTKGSAAEEFWKTHTRSQTPEVLRKKKQRPPFKP